MNKNQAVIIGYPVKHSLSPFIHKYWLQKYNIPGEYNLCEVAPDNIENFITDLKSRKYLSGANITVPYKEKIFNYVDEYDDIAAKIKAVNTISFDKAGKLIATNTDAYGFIANLYDHIKKQDISGKNILLIGAGGAARAIIYGLLKENIANIYIANRSSDKVEKIINDFYESKDKLHIIKFEDINKYLNITDILVNSTVLGMKGQASPDLDLSLLPINSIVTDIVYNPLKTKLLADAEERGNKIIDGLGMLIHQAIKGFELFFGVKPEIDDNIRQYIIKYL